MMWSTVKTVETENFNTENFWSAVSVWLERPHLLNRRVIGIKEVESISLNLSRTVTDTTILLNNIRKQQLEGTNISLTHIFVKELKTNDLENCTVVEICQRILLPKSPKKFLPVQEIVISDRQYKEIIFSSLYDESNTSLQHHLSPDFTYRLVGLKNGVRLDVLLTGKVDLNSAAIHWLKETVLPKIAKWTTEGSSSSSPPSLQLVQIERYSSLKHELKTKYGPQLVKMWTESTDPYKFVYEDIAIAAYLLALWENEREIKNIKEKQSFVDVGCGNGLLVHILSSEGHKGIGMDIRKREIWNLYENSTKLIESPLNPSDDALFPDFDWIIGNHSDELTPWIPLIAARSSYNCRAFLLPCCTFTFDGKYQRTHPGSSKYQSYLNFIEELCTEMGFHVKRDKLRIPSTKRVCFLCMDRNYEADDATIDIKRKSYIKKYSRNSDNCHDNSSVNGERLWLPSFQPRPKMEQVRNCTQLDRAFLDRTLEVLVKLLLRSGDTFLEIENADGSKKWHMGGSKTLEDIAKELSPHDRKELKKQCGGLQTLVRNHRNIFRIENGLVSLAVPIKNQQRNEQQKRTQCWHFLNHPDGCPHSDNECSYIHSKEKLF